MRDSFECSICKAPRNGLKHKTKNTKITHIFRSLDSELKERYVIVCDDKKCYSQIFDKLGRCVHCGMSTDTKEFKFLYIPLTEDKNIFMTNVLCSERCCGTCIQKWNVMVENLQYTNI
jgi:hypothetical protein